MIGPLEEGDRQMLLLALAICALDRPGWDHALGSIAANIPGGTPLYEEFKRLNADRFVAREAQPHVRMRGQHPERVTTEIAGVDNGHIAITTAEGITIRLTWRDGAIVDAYSGPTN